MSKLIRDGYVQILKPTEWRIVQPGSPEHFDLLEDKVLEELTELKESDFLDVDEYGDLLEILQSMAELKKIKWSDVLKANLTKGTKKGRFTGGTVLVDKNE